MNNITQIIKSIIDLIKDNKNVLKKINDEDNQINKFDFKVEKLIEVLSKYKNKNILVDPKNKILITHYGNPYITAMLCIEAIINNVQLTVGIEDFCYGLNKAIIKIIEDSLKKYKINIKISLQNNITNKEIEEKNFSKVVCLGNSNSYMTFKKIKNVEVKYVDIFGVMIYYDSEIFDELVDNIRNYAYLNFYEIEIFNQDEEFDDVIYIMNESQNNYCAIILSKDENKQQRFRNEIKSKIICVNENPFNKFELEIPKEVWRGGDGLN